MLGHKFVGYGLEKVLVLHDWLSDMTSYDTLIPYLNVDTFTYVFVDLRGYGKSKEQQGTYTVDEAAQDVMHLAEYLDWPTFHLIGHSMSGMIVQKIAALYPTHVKSIIGICPVPACGAKAPDDVLKGMEEIARHCAPDDVKALLQPMTAHRYQGGFMHYKASHWPQVSTADARVGYLRMFAKTDFSQEVEGLKTPILIITGAHDAEYGREEAKRQTFSMYPNASFITLDSSGHYPMQEQPPLLVEVVESFLEKHAT